MSTTKKYWKGIEELKGGESFAKANENEFAEHSSITEFVGDENVSSFKTDRRDFLKFLGFSVSAATLAACEAPVQKAIPYLIKPEEVDPGVANYYASSYFDGTDYASVLVKTREGRPIFIKGNTASTLTKGAVNARVNSSVLGLYDSKRARAFHKKDGDAYLTASSVTDFDAEIQSKLKAIAAKGGTVALLSGTIASPSTTAAINEFANAYAATEETPGFNFRHVQYDALSFSGMLDANKEVFGKRVIPTYNFANAKVVVSVAADFLQNWVNSLAYAKDFATRRNPDGEWMSRHYQFEANMTVTGSNADFRTIVKPSAHGTVVTALYNAIAAKTGHGKVSSNGELSAKADARVKKAAEELLAAKGQSIVVAGSNDKNIQVLVNGINQMLNNYNNTIDINKAVYLKQGDDQAVASLVKDMAAGKIDAVLIQGVNPAYALPAELNFNEALAKVGLKISFADRVTDETGAQCDYLTPDNHYLESWNDYQPQAGSYSFAQPAINPLFKTRQFQSSLLVWAGKDGDYYNFIKENWRAKAGAEMDTFDFDAKFNSMIHDGVAQMETAMPVEVEASESNDDGIEAMLGPDYEGAAKAIKSNPGEFEVEFYVSTAMGDGVHASNPWLQELPDPVTKIVWDNYLALSPAMMAKYNFNSSTNQKEMSNMVNVTVNGSTFKLPAIAQPGLPNGYGAIALGYGRDCGYEESMTIGVNTFGGTSINNGTVSFVATDASMVDAEEEYPVASTQTHHTMMGRKIVNETTIEEYKNTPHDHEINGWNKPTLIANAYGEMQTPDELNLWEDQPIDLGHRWGMSIDLNKCTGCSACVTSCHSENNVPVVGKEEVKKARDMHWLRIDRYYSSVEEYAGDKYHYDYDALENPEAEPQVVYQPVMCQHCNHAPCETVCPVAATTHSNEGLNQMAYNRCFGTRYCANNCPYKVRRFNWFNFTAYKKFTNFNPSTDDLGRMVLNPDVVVRTRGVMEKCSMCVQRIQAGKLEAKKADAPVQDGAIQTACSEACSFGAITFGDVNDTNSGVRKQSEHKRAYHLIEEVGTQPNIWYQTKVRNLANAEDHKTAGTQEV